MKILFIGGTGNISAACVRLAVLRGDTVTVLNRGKRPLSDYGIEGVESLLGDFRDEAGMKAILGERHFDVVANFIAYKPEDVERDIRLFGGRCGQYLFISSASAYQKPLLEFPITEETPVVNPYWQYSRDKIACEKVCEDAFRDHGFPAIIIRPSHTYETVIPLVMGGWTEFTVIDRMRKGLPVLVHGDGASLWTMTHSRDFAVGFLGLLGHPKAVGEAFHITSDEVMSWNRIYDLVGQAAGVAEVNKAHVPFEWISRMLPDMRGNIYGDKGACAVFDNAKIKSFVPEFKCEIPFSEGMKETLAWFEADAKRIHISEETHIQMDRVIESYHTQLKQLGP
ncbi:SDR family oxidoreductase [Kiritimatiellota bacterium B12222]|nr:SDR family oxidoreductase [Kiritimatiellota bacterium B12222]